MNTETRFQSLYDDDLTRFHYLNVKTPAVCKKIKYKDKILSLLIFSRQNKQTNKHPVNKASVIKTKKEENVLKIFYN